MRRARSFPGVLLLGPAAALMLAGCPPRGPSALDDTKLDGGEDADADADADSDSDTDVDSDSDSDTDTFTDTYYNVDCSAGPAVPGPWTQHPILEAGASATYDAYAFDAGVAALRDATVGNTTPTAVSIDISGAIVTARGYVPAVNDGTATFWFEDGGAAMQAYRVDLGGFDPLLLQPGDEVSFTATRVVDYFGTPEVAGDATLGEPGITNFQVISSGNPVHIVDVMGTGAVLEFSQQGSYIVEVWGELAAGPTKCGTTAKCYDLDYAGNIAIFRTASNYDGLGDCKHFIGPLTQFNGDPQLNVDDFDWAWSY